MEKPTKTAKQLLQVRASEVFSVAPGATVLSMLELFNAQVIDAVVVLEGDRLVGIVSQQDYARKGELLGKRATDTVVREIMTEKVIYVTPDDTVDQCRSLMHAKRVHHLPVVDGRRVIGMLSSHDILQEIIAEEEHLIHDLERDRMEIMNPDPSSY